MKFSAIIDNYTVHPQKLKTSLYFNSLKWNNIFRGKGSVPGDQCLGSVKIKRSVPGLPLVTMLKPM